MTEREMILKLAEVVRGLLIGSKAEAGRKLAEVEDALRATEPRESTPPPTSGRDESGKVRTEPVGQSALATAGTKPAGGVEPREVAKAGVCWRCSGAECCGGCSGASDDGYCAITGAFCPLCPDCHGTGKKSAPGEASEQRCPFGEPWCGNKRDGITQRCSTCTIRGLERDLAALRAWADEAPVNAAYTEGFITHYDHWIGRRPHSERPGASLDSKSEREGSTPSLAASECGCGCKEPSEVDRG